MGKVKKAQGKIIIICQTCGDNFNVYPSRKNTAKFCSISCKAEAMKCGTMRVCENCGNEFYAAPSRIKFAGARFCSDKCKDLARRNRVAKICKWCDKHFEISVSRSNLGCGRFCSVDCTNRWRAENDPRGLANQFFNQVHHTCETCGDKFWAKRDRDRARFCSGKCRGTWHSSAMSGVNSSSWQGGISFEPYPVEFTETFKKSVRERDENICAVCRFPGNCVHHIDYDKSNTVPENCITLCRPCHGVTSGSRPYWQATLTEIMGARADVVSGAR